MQFKSQSLQKIGLIHDKLLFFIQAESFVKPDRP